MASVKCAVSTITLIALSSILGTLIPQGLLDEEVFIRYGEDSLIAKLILFFGLTDLYHSLWFQALITFLAINILLCITERFSKDITLWKEVDRGINEENLKKMRNFKEFSVSRSYKETVEIIHNIIDKKWKVSFSEEVIDENNKRSWKVIYSRGKNSIFSTYGVHGSILLILIGCFISSTMGFSGFMSIEEDDSSNTVYLSKKAIILPFEVRCDNFEVQFYPDGTPKEYISKVSILEGGKEVQRAEIRVNHPFTYKGVTLYQASYGTIIKEASVVITDLRDNKTYQLKLSMKKEETIPSSGALIQLMSYREDLGGFGPAVALVVAEEGKQPVAGWILVNHPDFHGNILDRYRISIKQLNLSYYTGLHVKQDPGIGIVFAGFTTFVIFTFLTFYWTYKKIGLVVKENSGQTKVFIAGRANKNLFDFKEEFETLCKELEENLKEKSLNE